MKRSSKFLAVFAVAALLAGCGAKIEDQPQVVQGDQNPSPSPTPLASPTPTPTPSPSPSPSPTPKMVFGIDPTFNGGKALDIANLSGSADVSSLGIAPNNEMYISGRVLRSDGSAGFLAQANPDGSRRLDFGPGGFLETFFGPTYNYARYSNVSVQADKNIVVSGQVGPLGDEYARRGIVLRMLSDALPDVSYPNAGRNYQYTGVELLHSLDRPDDSLWIASTHKYRAPTAPLIRQRCLAAKLKKDGSSETAWLALNIAPRICNTIVAISAVANHKVVIVGQLVSSKATLFAIRLNQGGALDTTFGTGGISILNMYQAHTYVTALSNDASGVSYISGFYVDPLNQSQRGFIFKLGPDGKPVTAFGLNSVLEFPKLGEFRPVSIEAAGTGKLLLTGILDPRGAPSWGVVAVERVKGDPDTVLSAAGLFRPAVAGAEQVIARSIKRLSDGRYAALAEGIKIGKHYPVITVLKYRTVP